MAALNENERWREDKREQHTVNLSNQIKKVIPFEMRDKPFIDEF